MSGVLCVMTPGEVVMLLWCVDSWDTSLKVNKHAVSISSYTCTCLLIMQFSEQQVKIKVVYVN